MDLRRDKHGIVTSEGCRVEVALDVVVQVGINSREERYSRAW